MYARFAVAAALRDDLRRARGGHILCRPAARTPSPSPLLTRHDGNRLRPWRGSTGAATAGASAPWVTATTTAVMQLPSGTAWPWNLTKGRKGTTGRATTWPADGPQSANRSPHARTPPIERLNTRSRFMARRNARSPPANRFVADRLPVRALIPSTCRVVTDRPPRLALRGRRQWLDPGAGRISQLRGTRHDATITPPRTNLRARGLSGGDQRWCDPRCSGSKRYRCPPRRPLHT